jgi:hypothetical protein
MATSDEVLVNQPISQASGSCVISNGLERTPWQQNGANLERENRDCGDLGLP